MVKANKGTNLLTNPQPQQKSMEWQAAQKVGGRAPTTDTQHIAAQQDSMERSHVWQWTAPGCQSAGWRAGRQWSGKECSYLSIQKICWRWGSDRCPFHMLPHAAWVEKSRKEGNHWAVAQDNLAHTHGRAGTLQRRTELNQQSLWRSIRIKALLFLYLTNQVHRIDGKGHIGCRIITWTPKDSGRRRKTKQEDMMWRWR